MWSIIFISSLCLAAPISAQLQNNNAPLNCVLNEKRPNPLNVHTFYYCRADGPTLMMCPDGLTFDSIALDCVRQTSQPTNNISVAKIPSGGGSPPPSSGGWSSPPPPPPSGGWSSQSPPPSSGGWSSQSPPPPSGGWSSQPPPSGGWSPPSGTPSTQCPPTDPNPGDAVILPNKSDCTKFFICSNGTPYPFDCAPGGNLVFNINSKVCEFPTTTTDPDCPNPNGTPLPQREESINNEI